MVSRNISEASNPDYARRSAVVSSTAPGARIAEIRRAADDVLFRLNLSSTSDWQAQQAISKGLDILRTQVNGIDNANAPASAIRNLQAALQTYAATPSNRSLAEEAVGRAHEVVRSLNEGTNAIQSFRAQIDREIAISVKELNEHLAAFEKANKEVMTGTRAGRDVSDALDRRDALLKEISCYVSVNTISRVDNDMVLVTSTGITLFETVPRAVSFTPQNAYQAGMSGNAITIDGVPLSAGGGGNTSASGSLAAQLQLRDDIVVQMQRQLDEIARGLSKSFAESDPAGAGPDQAGLFTWPGGPGIPESMLLDGIAGRIAVNPAIDSSAGGNPEGLRDGVAYNHNPEGHAAYSDLLNAYVERLDEPMDFDPAAGLGSSESLMSFSGSAISWLESLRHSASSATQAKAALYEHTATSLANQTGVNIDEELALLLELERSYEASARLMNVIDEMLATLLEAAR